MTAHENTRGQRDKTSVGDSPRGDHQAALDPDEQAIIEYLDERGDCSLEQLRGRLRIPKTYLKSILRDLEADGYIDVDCGFTSVRVTRLNGEVDGREAIPDGGIEQLSDALRVDLAARDIYRAVCNRRRRATIRILSALRNADEVDINRYVSVQSIACAIVATRESIEPEAVDSDQRSSVYVTLVQTHLPLLDRLDLVVYHQRPQKVEITAEGMAVAKLLGAVDRVAVHVENRADADLFRNSDLDEWGNRR